MRLSKSFRLLLIPALLGVGLIAAGGWRDGTAVPPDAKPFRTERDRLENEIVRTANRLEGKVIVNDRLVVPKGVLMIFTPSNTVDAATFGEIGHRGDCQVENVPLGEIIVVLRPDTETILDTEPSPDPVDLPARRPKSRQYTRAPLRSTIDPSFWKGVPEEHRFTLESAMFHYGRPTSQDRLKVNILEGVNQTVLNFKIPRNSYSRTSP